jgi:hypothetical protein
MEVEVQDTRKFATSKLSDLRSLLHLDVADGQG